MKRCGWDTVLLLEQARSETEGMTDQYRPSRFVDVGDAFVSEPQVLRDGAEHELQPPPRVPRSGCFDITSKICAETVSRNSSPARLHDLLERAGRHDDDVVAAGTKRAAEADERVDVAGRSDGSHDETS